MVFPFVPLRHSKHVEFAKIRAHEGYALVRAEDERMPLILVPTPLGNLRDITLRALDVLRDAALIIAEDTRVTRKLLSAHDISAHDLATYNEYTSASGMEAILDRAESESVAVVSDAGMPGICDPGAPLLARARARRIAVEVLPGPSAFLAAAVLSGFPIAGLSFEGFVPRTDGQRCSAFTAALARQRTSIWYEAPHRILATLRTVERIAPIAPVFIVREYTKRFEQQILGTASDALRELAVPIRGEFVIVVDGRGYEAQAPGEGDVDARIDALLAEGRPPTVIAKRLASVGLGSRNELYRRASARGKHTPGTGNLA